MKIQLADFEVANADLTIQLEKSQKDVSKLKCKVYTLIKFSVRLGYRVYEELIKYRLCKPYLKLLI